MHDIVSRCLSIFLTVDSVLYFLSGLSVAIKKRYIADTPVPVAAQVCGHSPAEIVGSNPAGGMEVSFILVLCCQADVSATSWSLVQRSPTDCGASLCVMSEEAMARVGLQRQNKRK